MEYSKPITTKEDLARAKKDKDYILINRITKEYYDAEANEWKPIQDIDKETKE